MFDPYAKWLGITKRTGTPNHFELLGVSPDIEDADVIASVADMRMAHVRTFQSGQYSKESQQILNELSQARICLLDPQRRAAYRATLAQEQALKAPAAPPPNAERPLSAAPAAAGWHAQHEDASTPASPESTASAEPWSIDVDSATAARGSRGKRPGPPPSRRIAGSGLTDENPFASTELPTAAPPPKFTDPPSSAPRRVVPQAPSGRRKILFLVLGGAAVVVGTISAGLLMYSREGTSVGPALAAYPLPGDIKPAVETSPSPPPKAVSPPKPADTKASEARPAKPPADTPKKPDPPVKEKQPATPLPPLVAYDRGEPVNLLAAAGLPGDIIKVAGPPVSQFEVTGSGLKKLPASAALESSLLPLPLGMQTAKEKWKQESYRFSTRVTPQSPGAVFFSFPVSQRQFVAFFGGAGRNVGFAVQPLQVSNEVRKDVGPVQGGRAYNFEITVQTLADDQARITALLDGKTVIQWQGSTQHVAPDDSVAALPNQNEQVVFGFGTQQEIAAELHEFKVQKLPRDAKAEHRAQSNVLLGQQ